MKEGTNTKTSSKLLSKGILSTFIVLLLIISFYTGSKFQTTTTQESPQIETPEEQENILNQPTEVPNEMDVEETKTINEDEQISDRIGFEVGEYAITMDTPTNLYFQSKPKYNGSLLKVFKATIYGYDIDDTSNWQQDTNVIGFSTEPQMQSSTPDDLENTASPEFQTIIIGNTSYNINTYVMGDGSYLSIDVDGNHSVKLEKDLYVSIFFKNFFTTNTFCRPDCSIEEKPFKSKPKCVEKTDCSNYKDIKTSHITSDKMIEYAKELVRSLKWEKI